MTFSVNKKKSKKKQNVFKQDKEKEPFSIQYRCVRYLRMSVSCRYNNMIVVPDDVLETLICDICKNYLSVKPVAVRKTGKHLYKLCGRCTRSRKGLVISKMYGYFAEIALFKCIYRFNGCKKLLTWDKVHEHEKNECSFSNSSNFYDNNCSVCKYEPKFDGLKQIFKISNYELIQHLRRAHMDSFLRSKIIKTTFKEFECWQYFIYLMDNDIYFFFFKFKRRDQVFLFKAIREACDLEEECVEIKGQVTIENESVARVFQFQSKSFKKEVSVVSEVNQLFFGNPSVVIELELSYPNCEITELKEEHFIDSYRRLRKLQTMHYIPSTINLSSCHTKLVFKDLDGQTITINIECLMCSRISIDNIFIISNGHQRNLLCKQCSFIYDSQYMDLVSILNYNIMTVLKFSCIWDCGSFFDINVINEHESQCQNAPLDECPICGNYVAAIDNMKKHLLEYHNRKLHTINNIYLNVEGLKSSIILILNEAYLKCDFEKVSRDHYLSELQYAINVTIKNPLKHFRNVSIVFTNELTDTSFTIKRGGVFDAKKLPATLHFRPQYLM